MFKIGLIGCGFMGSMHADCYSAISGVQVAAVADIRADKAAALAQKTGAKIYSSGMELIENAGVDAIDICLPTYLHTPHALAAMDRVKYVFIEKPVALNLEECANLLQKQKQTGCAVQVGQVIRFWDEYMYLKRVTQEKTYGAPVNANFRRLSPRPLWGWESWLLKENLSGGAAQDLHIHDTDFMLHLFGEPEKMYTVSNTRGEKFSYINTVCSYKNFCASVEGTWDLPSSYPFEMYFRVVFEKAVLEFAKGVLTVYEGGQSAAVELKKYEAKSGFTGGNVSDLGGYYNELKYFTDTAKAGQNIEKATLKEGVKSLEFIIKEKSGNE